MVDILSLVLQHDEQAVLCAVEMALEAGVPTKTHILNLLHRLVDRKATDHPEVDPPDALSLQNAPQANVDATTTFEIRRMNAMRHDPAGASIVIMLHSLKLHGMAQAVNDLVDQGAPAFEAAIPMLSQLLKAEMAEREVRSIHCPAGDCAATPRGGGPGTGKSHVATAIGVQAIEHHRRKVRFFSTVELVNALKQEKANGKAGKLADTLTKIDLVILDELGYLPFSASGGALLFHLLSKLYERTSVIPSRRCYASPAGQ